MSVTVDAVALAIFKDRLASDDWNVITQYEAILAPLEEAIKDLQDRPGDVQHGSADCALETLEYLVEHPEEVKARHQGHPESRRALSADG